MRRLVTVILRVLREQLDALQEKRFVNWAFEQFGRTAWLNSLCRGTLTCTAHLG